MTGFEAKRKCKKPDVHCCIEGRISSLSLEKCRRKGGKGYASLFEAKRKCKTKEVFCCVQGKIQTLLARQCKDRRGLSYSTAGEAKRKCGWYRDQGRLISYNLLKNSKTNLKLHPTKEKARQECWEQKRKGFCCTPQGVVGMMKAECKRPNRFFTSKKRVEAQCLGQKEKVRQVKISELRKDKNNQFRKKLDRQLPGRQPAHVQAGVIGRRVKGEEHGIYIYQPGSDHDRFLPVPGGRLLIRYTFVSYPDDLPGHISVILKNADGSREWNLGDEAPERGTDIIKFIPGDIPQERGYTITLRSVDELPGITPRYGVSDPFTIALPTSGGGERCEDCFYITSPAGGDRWLENSSQEIAWLYTGSAAVDGWNLQLTCVPRSLSDYLATGRGAGYQTLMRGSRSNESACEEESGRCWTDTFTPVLPDDFPDESACWITIRAAGEGAPYLVTESRPFEIYRTSGNIELLYPETDRRHVFTLGACPRIEK